jgi:hypothetical protein
VTLSNTCGPFDEEGVGMAMTDRAKAAKQGSSVRYHILPAGLMMSPKLVAPSNPPNSLGTASVYIHL